MVKMLLFFKFTALWDFMGLLGANCCCLIIEPSYLFWRMFPFILLRWNALAALQDDESKMTRATSPERKRHREILMRPFRQPQAFGSFSLQSLKVSLRMPQRCADSLPFVSAGLHDWFQGTLGPASTQAGVCWEHLFPLQGKKKKKKN